MRDYRKFLRISLRTLVLFPVLAGVWSVEAQVSENVIEIPVVSSTADVRLDGELGYDVLNASFTPLFFPGEECLGFRGGLFAKRTDTVLYVALYVELDRDLQDLEAFVAFDTSGDSQLFNRGDDISIVQVDLSQGVPMRDGIDFAYEGTYYFVQDTTLGGSDDAVAAATLTDRILVAEFLRPLDSGDERGMDGDLSTDEPVLISVGFTGSGSWIETRWDGWVVWRFGEPPTRRHRVVFVEDPEVEPPEPASIRPPSQRPHIPSDSPDICWAWEQELNAYAAVFYPLMVEVTRGTNSSGLPETTITDITLRIIHFKERERGPCVKEKGHEGSHQPWTWSAWREDGIDTDVIRTTVTIGGWPTRASSDFFERWLTRSWHDGLAIIGLGKLSSYTPFPSDWYTEKVTEKLK